MAFLLSPRSNTIAQRFNIKTAESVLSTASSAFGVDRTTLSKTKLIAVLNTISNLLHGRSTLQSVKRSTLSDLCAVWGIQPPDSDDPEDFHDVLQARFFGPEEVRALMAYNA
jgi:hypothetical protein